MATDPVLSDPLLVERRLARHAGARARSTCASAPPVRGGRRVRVPGLPVRVPLPALAQRARPLAATAHRSVARARHRDPRDGRRQRGALVVALRALRAGRPAQLARRRRREPRAARSSRPSCRAGRWSTRGSRRTTRAPSAASSWASRRRSSSTWSAPTYWLETIVASSGAFHREREGVAEPSLLYEPSASAYGTFALFLGRRRDRGVRADLPRLMGADDLPGLLAVVAAALYARGLRRPVQGSAGARDERVARLRACRVHRRGLARHRRRALEPVRRLADQLLWAHMAQHVLLVARRAAARRARRAVDAALARAAARRPPRRSHAGWCARARPLRPVRRGAPLLTTPAGAFAVFNVDLCSGTCRRSTTSRCAIRPCTISSTRSSSRRASSSGRSCLPSWPLHAPASASAAASSTRSLASLRSWGLAVVLAFYPTPLYSAYAGLASRPGGISALGDQRLAAGRDVGARLDPVRARDPLRRLSPPRTRALPGTGRRVRSRGRSVMSQSLVVASFTPASTRWSSRSLSC